MQYFHPNDPQNWITVECIVNKEIVPIIDICSMLRFNVNFQNCETCDSRHNLDYAISTLPSTNKHNVLTSEPTLTHFTLRNVYHNHDQECDNAKECYFCGEEECDGICGEIVFTKTKHGFVWLNKI
jgi:hypothetical protein